MSTSSSARPPPRPKATLFCPDCGHESHVGGDWVVSETARRVRTECPACRTAIDDRPRGQERPARFASGTPRSSGAARTPAGLLLRLQCDVLDWWRRYGSRLVADRTSV